MGLLNLSLSLLGGVAPILAIFDQNFELRKVNHTLGDHRSGRAWDSNHGPNETDGRHMSEKTKNLRKKLPNKKNEKFSEKKTKQKNTKKHLVWYPCLCPL